MLARDVVKTHTILKSDNDITISVTVEKVLKFVTIQSKQKMTT